MECKLLRQRIQTRRNSKTEQAIMNCFSKCCDKTWTTFRGMLEQAQLWPFSWVYSEEVLNGGKLGEVGNKFSCDDGFIYRTYIV